MKNLYRRYRPLKLEDIIGQEQVTKPLGNALDSGRVNHAYLFVGPRGCGKTSVARILAHKVNDFDYTQEDEYVDIIEIDGASNRGIDNIRELREKVAIAPTVGKYKVYIIDEVHMLTKEAFNALLKTLEEPPEHVIFIMATTDAYKVPVTITSRAQTYTFKLADRAAMVGYLRTICDKEGIKITDDALEIVAKRGGGSFRDSLSLLDQISTLSDTEITKEMVVSAMGLPQSEKITEILDAYLAGDVVKITTLLKELLSSGIKPETLAEEMITEIVENPQPKLLGLLEKLPDVKAPFPEAKLLVALLGGSVYAPEILFSGPARSPEMSYAGTPAEPPASRANLSGPSGIYISERPNRKLSREKVFPGAPTESPKAAPAGFDWNNFVATVRGMNDAISMQLEKTQHEVVGDTLHIYPQKKIGKTILARDNNKRILIGAVNGLKIEIHDPGEAPNSNNNDELISKMSAIMGGEVKNDTGGNPF